jgi:hypothetical protein
MAASRSTRPDPIGSARVPRSAGADGDKPSGQALGNSAKCAAAGIRGHPAVGFGGFRGNGERCDEFEAMAVEYRPLSPRAGPRDRYCLANRGADVATPMM